MDSSRRIALAKTLRAHPKETSAKAGASSTPITESNLPTSPTPLTTQTPNSPHSLQTPNSPPPIAAVPLAVAANLTPAPLDKGKGVLVAPLMTKTLARGKSSRGGGPTGSSPHDLPPPNMESRCGTTLPVPHLPHYKQAKRRGQNPHPHQHKLRLKLPPHRS